MVNLVFRACHHLRSQWPIRLIPFGADVVTVATISYMEIDSISVTEKRSREALPRKRGLVALAFLESQRFNPLSFIPVRIAIAG
jgi:hypothetical protein